MTTIVVTLSGARVDLAAPVAGMIRLADIAHNLARIARYCGGTSIPYSVAEHSVRVADLVWSRTADRAWALRALLHDAAEAYVGDVPAPLRRMMARAGNDFFDHTDEAILAAVHDAAGLPTCAVTLMREGRAPVYGAWVPAVRDADQTLYATETRDLRHPGIGTPDLDAGVAPLPERIRPWPIDLAETEFLDRLAEWLPEDHAFRRQMGRART